MEKEIFEEVRKIIVERMLKEYDVKMENYRGLNAVCKKGQILFTGSSLMEGFPIVELAQGSGCRYQIYNRGIGGYTTQNFIDSIDVVLFDLEPSKIFINIGTNDISSPDYELSKLLGQYQIILNAIQTRLPKAKTYIMAFYPLKPTVGDKQFFGGRTNEKLREANAALKELAASYRNSEFIDVNDGLCDEEGNLKAEWTFDGIHMYSVAYRRVFQNLLPYLLV